MAATSIHLVDITRTADDPIRVILPGVPDVGDTILVGAERRQFTVTSRVWLSTTFAVALQGVYIDGD